VLRFIKSTLYPIKRRLFPSTVLSDRDREALRLLSQHHITDPILLCGHQKSGNTWLRFLIFNYFNILNHGATDTLTYRELNTLQCQQPTKPDTITPIPAGFPPLFRTHNAYRPLFDYFRLIYLYRHPLDTLISYYYWIGAKERYDVGAVDSFVLEYLGQWIRHYQRTYHKAMIVVSYEKLKADTYGVTHELLSALGYEVDSTVLQLSVDVSSFDNVQQMGRETGQEIGMGVDSNDTFHNGFEFTRSGEVNQYEAELRRETIEQAQIELRNHGIHL
jgi:hypothetical protein